MDDYRIKRVDSRNLAIQRYNGKRWVTISYHGNSLNSLISGITDLIVSNIIPDEENVVYGLKTLKSELIKSTNEVKEVIGRNDDRLKSR